jgi:hypothetical protein
MRREGDGLGWGYSHRWVIIINKGLQALACSCVPYPTATHLVCQVKLWHAAHSP